MSIATPARRPGYAAALLLVFFLAANPAAKAIAPWFTGVQYGTAVVGDPLFEETTLSIFYPAGGFPNIWGVTTPVMPVVVMVHGGNGLLGVPSSPNELSDLAKAMLAQGFVVVMPNFHVLDLAGEDYLHATKDVARVFQFLRYYHSIVNIDPARVFGFGHSAGGFHALYVGLNVDFKDPGAADPVLHETSRPDFLIPWGAPSDWTCYDFAHAANPWASLMVFGIPDAANVPLSMKQAHSPTWWLAHPALYGRTTTPPMCLVYNLDLVSPCGAIIDVHDGEFGILLDKGIKRLCLLGGAAGQPVCSESVLVTAIGEEGANQAVIDWMVAQAF